MYYIYFDMQRVIPIGNFSSHVINAEIVERLQLKTYKGLMEFKLLSHFKFSHCMLYSLGLVG